MKNAVTLVIILHNRHRNLDRLLEYYVNFESPIIIADSSKEEHFFSNWKANLTYLYTPGLTYTQKIEKLLDTVTTPYMVMNADDDFIVPAGLYDCVQFLNDNESYSAAQGMILKYYKNTIEKKVRFGLLYKGDYSLNMDDPMERLQNLFHPYKSLLYAVHRTNILRACYKNAGKGIRNLYLNEYLVSIGTVLLGKTKDMPSLYQLREYTEDSDDKITDNLDVILSAEKHKQELQYFLDNLVTNLAIASQQEKVFIKRKIEEGLTNYAAMIVTFRRPVPSLKKKIGLFIKLIPFFGQKWIEFSRRKEVKKELSNFLSLEYDQELRRIEGILKRFK
jgi:glycosyltransferase domain-containing protein